MYIYKICALLTGRGGGVLNYNKIYIIEHTSALRMSMEGALKNGPIFGNNKFMNKKVN